MADHMLNEQPSIRPPCTVNPPDNMIHTPIITWTESISPLQCTLTSTFFTYKYVLHDAYGHFSSSSWIEKQLWMEILHNNVGEKFYNILRKLQGWIDHIYACNFSNFQHTQSTASFYVCDITLMKVPFLELQWEVWGWCSTTFLSLLKVWKFENFIHILLGVHTITVCEIRLNSQVASGVH